MGKAPGGPARFLRTHYLIALLIPALIVVLTITGFVWAQKGVTVVVDGESRLLKTQADDVAGLLSQADIDVDSGDLVTPAPGTPVEDGMHVVVRHTVPVALDLAGETLELDIVGTTVADALVAAGLDPGSGLAVEPGADEPIVGGMKITVTDAYLRFVEETATVPFKVVTTTDPNLPSGARVVTTKGSPGVALRVYQVLVVNGVAGTRTLKTETLVSAPTDEVHSVGTKRSGGSPARAKALNAPAPKGGRQLTVTTTAYAPGTDGVDHTTATGARAGYGIIAVDPRVIPLGTRLYIPGYGYGVAADTGGAIKGNKIDLCFNTRAEAIAWGRRTVTITILP